MTAARRNGAAVPHTHEGSDFASIKTWILRSGATNTAGGTLPLPKAPLAILDDAATPRPRTPMDTAPTGARLAAGPKTR
jgi:hypothetical protein